jgi:hypothetical protein
MPLSYEHMMRASESKSRARFKMEGGVYLMMVMVIIAAYYLLLVILKNHL